MAPESVIEKVKKLMALADNAGTEAEAELAFEKAQALMVKHAISELQLTPAEREKIVERRIDLPQRDEIRRAKLLLFNELCRANRCQSLSSSRSQTVIGFKSDVDFVEMLFASVMIQYAGERTRAWKAYRAETDEWDRVSRHIWVNAFAWAYAQRVGQRLREAARREVESQDAAAPGTALVLVDRAKEAEDWMHEQYPRLKTKSLSVRGNRHANSAGHDAANRADISGGRGNLGGGRAGELG
jgi:hypothetical protein